MCTLAIRMYISWKLVLMNRCFIFLAIIGISGIILSFILYIKTKTRLKRPDWISKDRFNTILDIQLKEDTTSVFHLVNIYHDNNLWILYALVYMHRQSRPRIICHTHSVHWSYSLLQTSFPYLIPERLWTQLDWICYIGVDKYPRVCSRLYMTWFIPVKYTKL